MLLQADDEHGESHDQRRSEHGGDRNDTGRGEDFEDSVPAVDNPLYAETCGACHFAYQPALLPAASWRLLLSGVEDHFGLPLGLDSGVTAELEAYLTAESAEYAPGEIARKIPHGAGSRVFL